MTHRSGYVIGKRIKTGFLGKKSYFIMIKFDIAFTRKGENMHEYEVDKQCYENYIRGAFVRGEFDQTPDGLSPLYFY